MWSSEPDPPATLELVDGCDLHIAPRSRRFDDLAVADVDGDVVCTVVTPAVVHRHKVSGAELAEVVNALAGSRLVRADARQVEAVAVVDQLHQAGAVHTVVR